MKNPESFPLTFQGHLFTKRSSFTRSLHLDCDDGAFIGFGHHTFLLQGVCGDYPAAEWNWDWQCVID